MNSDQYEKQYTEFKKRSKTDGRFSIEEGDKQAQLTEDTENFSYDSHYMYHTAWAARKLSANKPKKHVDVSSYIYFSTIVSAFVPVEFLDYRPLGISLHNLRSGKADLTHLDREDNSIDSLSCMHVIEHVGLGRYGDSLDPHGDKVAAGELKRVLAPGGSLYIVLPVAASGRVCFNAHRVYSFRMVQELFDGLHLKSNALLSDKGTVFIEDATEDVYSQQHYGCGCFEFLKVA